MVVADLQLKLDLRQLLQVFCFASVDVQSRLQITFALFVTVCVVILLVVAILLHYWQSWDNKLVQTCYALYVVDFNLNVLWLADH
jgi:hypothetical protein